MEWLRAFTKEHGTFFALLGAIMIGISLVVPMMDRTYREERRRARQERKVREEWEHQLDERQEQIRGKAAHRAYMTMVLGLGACAIVEVLAGIQLGTLMIMSICSALSLDVYAVPCIFQDAWFGPREEKRKRKEALFLSVCLLMVGGVGAEMNLESSRPLVVFGGLLILIPSAIMAKECSERMGEPEYEDEEEEDVEKEEKQ